jgi:hypothetical protein
VITKNDFNAAAKRVQLVDQKLGKLEKQISDARVRALDCMQKAEAKKVSVPIDAPFEEHLAAAGASGGDFARFEGERKYWATLHARLMPELIAARREAVQAELDVVETVRMFWDDRFNEQAKAFFARNHELLRDLFGTLAMLRNGPPTSNEFWAAVMVHAPQNDPSGNLSEYIPGIRAAERILPPAPVAENLRGDQRNAARVLLNGFADERNQRAVAAVGVDASSGALDALRERHTSAKRVVQQLQERLAVIPRELEDAKNHLKEAVRVGAPEQARRLQAAIDGLTAEVQSKQSAIRHREVELLEITDDLAAVELERAKLKAVEI